MQLYSISALLLGIHCMGNAEHLWMIMTPGHQESLSRALVPKLCLEVEETGLSASGMAWWGRSGLIVCPSLCGARPTPSHSSWNESLFEKEFTSGLVGTPSGLQKETRWAALLGGVIPVPCPLVLPNHTVLVEPAPFMGAIRENKGIGFEESFRHTLKNHKNWGKA